VGITRPAYYTSGNALKMMAPYYSNDYLRVGPLFISNTQNIEIVFFLFKYPRLFYF
jgi:hypothetical protein